MTHLRKLANAFAVGIWESMLYLPLLLVVGHLWLQADRFGIWIALWPLAFVVGCGLRLLLIKTYYLFYLLAILSISIGAGLLLDVDPLSWLIISAAALFFMIRGGHYAIVHRLAHHLPAFIPTVSLIVYFVMVFLSGTIAEITALNSSISWAGAAVLIGSLLLSNHFTLQTETLHNDEKRFRLASAVTGPNRLYVIGLLVVAWLISRIGDIKALLDWIREQINAWLRSLESAEEEEISQPPPPAAEQQPPVLPDGEPFWLWKLLEEIFYWIVMVGLIIGAVFFVIWISRRLRGFSQRLWKWLQEKLHIGNQPPASSGYEDEQVSLMNWQDWMAQTNERIRNWAAERFKRDENWSDMQTNQERARYLYRRLVTDRVRKGMAFNPAHTPHEIAETIEQSDQGLSKQGTDQQLPHEISEIYSRAVYGDADTDEQHLLRMKERLNKSASKK